VRHFRIESAADDMYKLQGSPSPPFHNLTELVAYHKRKRSGLTTVLRMPCPREQAARAPDISFEAKDKWEVPRDTIVRVAP